MAPPPERPAPRSASKPKARKAAPKRPARRGLPWVFLLGLGLLAVAASFTWTLMSARGQAAKRPVKPKGAITGRVAIVIDDCGHSFERDREFVDSGYPLTLAVLPHLKDSERVARAARARGKCVLLHLPMESRDGRDPGPGTLRSEMSDAELAAALAANLRSVPGAEGVNNHQGSRGSADRRQMAVVLREIGRRKLFYLDSRTTADTVAPELAPQLRVPFVSRDRFLDNLDRPSAIRGELTDLFELARRQGGVVGIAHARPNTLQALQQELPRLAQHGLQVVPLRELVQPSPEEAG